MNKTCTKCKIEKDISEFHKSKNIKSGYKPRCKMCRSTDHKIYNKKYKQKISIHYKNSRKKIKNRNLLNLPEHATNKICFVCKKLKPICRFSKDITRIDGYKYKCKSCEKLIGQEYCKNNPESTHKRSRTRRARIKKINEIYTCADEKYTKLLFNNTCVNCGSTERLCIDHHYPLAKGYALSKTNATLLCRSCNASKGAKLPTEFYSPDKLQLINTKLRQSLKTSSSLNEYPGYVQP